MFTTVIAFPFSKRRQVTEKLESKPEAEYCGAVIATLTRCGLRPPLTRDTGSKGATVCNTGTCQ